MTTKAIALLAALLLVASPGLAQDCGKGGCDKQGAPSCEGGKQAGDCSGSCETACGGEMKQVCASLKAARAALAEAPGKESALTAEQRRQLIDARTFLKSSTANGMAMVPTLGVNAGLLKAAADEEANAAGDVTPAAALMRDMAETYRAMACMLDPACAKRCESDPECCTPEDMRAAIAKTDALWAKVAAEKQAGRCCADKEQCKQHRKTAKELCPVAQAMPEAMKALDAGFAQLATMKLAGGSDMVQNAAKYQQSLAKAAEHDFGSSECGSSCGDGSGCGTTPAGEVPGTGQPAAPS